MAGNRKFITFLNKLSWSMAIWIGAAFIFGFIRVWGVESLPAFERVLPFHGFMFSTQMVVLGLAIGIPFAIIDYVLDINVIRRWTYWRIIGLKVLIQVMIAIFSLAVLVISSNTSDDVQLSMMTFIFSETSVLWIIFSGIVSFFIYFLEVVKTKIGDRVIFNLLLRKYHNPRVESRIFMFLDMKDSTVHGEKLGHIKFSSLIQDSLNDLTSAILAHKVEVYQYVGDEAVLTWSLNNGFENANCLEVYYTFMKTLESKSAYYNQTYGFVPFFKAGVHLGEVTVSEVGTIKREIAYHSDVLNTAARIQGKCNEFKAELLISEDLKDKIDPSTGFEYEHIGGISLKGKEQLVNIYRVRKEAQGAG